MPTTRQPVTPPVFILSIAVRSAVLKYLLKKMNLIGRQEPFRLSKSSQAGRLLYHLLRKPEQDRQYDTSVGQYPQTLTVAISKKMVWLDGCRHLTAQAIHDFNRQVEDMLEEEFLSSLRVLREYGVPIETKQYAKDFMALYDFTEDDISLDALIKADYRRRKAAGQRLAPVKPAVSMPKCPVASRPLQPANV
ncbi:hypothetical protein [Hymenobacter pini]|uniref:hypothetical protein n=1 Tax=Hymenobacter pini TaxID=2880879 RepID=UPI001CF57874|nr:hypothetical protein [Hymenobacter pini]MCA8830165.1 hypothetical protein [Hymenobacter pini]